MKNLLRTVVIFVVCILNTAACSSVIARTSGKGEPIYPGVQEDLAPTKTGGFIGNFDELNTIISIVDFPFSLVLDTVLLPVDLLIFAISVDPESPPHPVQVP